MEALQHTSKEKWKMERTNNENIKPTGAETIVLRVIFGEVDKTSRRNVGHAFYERNQRTRERGNNGNLPDLGASVMTGNKKAKSLQNRRQKDNCWS